MRPDGGVQICRAHVYRSAGRAHLPQCVTEALCKERHKLALQVMRKAGGRVVVVSNLTQRAGPLGTMCHEREVATKYVERVAMQP